MTSLPDTVVLHLGAHKTASTHLQRSIGAARVPGIAFYGPPHLREPGQTLPERFGFPLDPNEGSRARMPVVEILAQMARGASRLVLSDENFAGKIQTGWGRIPTPLYRTAAHRVAALAQAIDLAGGPPLDICLGIRDPAGYMTSVYSQILHGKRVVKPLTFLKKNHLESIDWVDYVERLRAVPHVGRVTVWRFEDHAQVFSQTCAALVGTANVTPLSERIQPRLSQAALDAVLLAKAMNAPNAVAEAAAIFPTGATHAPFTLYDETAQAQSGALYTRQLSTLERMDGVTVLRPQ